MEGYSAAPKIRMSVVILQDVADVAKARTWVGSDDLKAAMQKSGVIGSPSVRFAV
jgi:hypothetical protein